MRTLNKWFSEYGKSHQNTMNQKIHWVCVPVIYLTIVAMIWQWHAVSAYGLLVVTTLYYLFLSRPIGCGMLLFNAVVVWLTFFSQKIMGDAFMSIMLLLFVLAWIGQFVGHKIEGVKPSFFDDLQFLLIGPAWVLSHLYDRFKLNY